MIWCSCEKSVSTLISKDLLDMKDVIVFSRYAGKFSNFSFCSSPQCQTLSKACVRSKDGAVVYCFFSKPCTINSDMRWILWHVECLVLNPNWCFGIT